MKEELEKYRPSKDKQRSESAVEDLKKEIQRYKIELQTVKK